MLWHIVKSASREPKGSGPPFEKNMYPQNIGIQLYSDFRKNARGAILNAD